MQYRLGVVLLAGGSASRYGRNKLLETSGGKSLIEQVIGVYAPLTLQPVVLVTGAYHKALSSQIRRPDVICHYNPHWQQGMGNSLASGLSAGLARFPATSHWLIGLGDQPRVSTASLSKLVKASNQSPHKMVASAWKDRLTAPAIFPVEHCKTLTMLTGDRGAAWVLRQGAMTVPSTCEGVIHPEAEWDIDTPEDWAKFHC
ncbi:nucleotidyltransferase family protein [Alteromonas aestuariivivens]|uniref:nucleotidyltransferase family protein n=1 Tax=Alteromonas aestuariivivens TaxID=1938339 RepID=UPI0015F28BBE|nr:nucleotidyltransferase family protein [Alteromonas aestuariivivens]